MYDCAYTRNLIRWSEVYVREKKRRCRWSILDPASLIPRYTAGILAGEQTRNFKYSCFELDQVLLDITYICGFVVTAWNLGVTCDGVAAAFFCCIPSLGNLDSYYLIT